jgi:hypothetical protein
MQMLSEIKPERLNRVIDVVEAAGVDVSAWIASGNPANPKYCYEWAFSDATHRVVVLCLWHDECEEDERGVYQTGSMWPLIKRLEVEKASTAPRARRFDDTLQRAWHEKSVIRVAIVDQSGHRKATQRDGDTMHADFRELDPLPWNLISYDHKTGEYELRRGADNAGVAVAEASLDDKSGLGMLVGFDGEDTSADDPSVVGISRSAQLVEDIFDTIGRSDIGPTTRDALVQARVGQGIFRERLVRHWGGRCAVTGCSNLAVLRASHIKPWRKCGDAERLDVHNGLLLTANLDALFDGGLIAFHEDGSMWIAPSITERQRGELGLPGNLRMELNSAQRGFIEGHRTEAMAAVDFSDS